MVSSLENTWFGGIRLMAKMYIKKASSKQRHIPRHQTERQTHHYCVHVPVDTAKLHFIEV